MSNFDDCILEFVVMILKLEHGRYLLNMIRRKCKCLVALPQDLLQGTIPARQRTIGG
jgi:hypothetical protein